MASSGTFTSNPRSYLYLDLEWRTIEQQVANNRSKVRLTLKLRQTGNGMWFSANKSGRLDGASFTYTGGFSGTGTRTLHSRDVWVNHNSDGRKTVTFDASFNIAINYLGSHLSSMSVSGRATLDQIPRASDLDSASVSNALKPSTGNTLNLSIDRKYSGFSHLVTILDGGGWVADWGYGTATPSSLSISGSAVNRMLNRMRNTTSKTFTLRVRTYSGSDGSGYIGQSTKNFTVTVDSSVKPVISKSSTEIIGNSWAKDNNIYVQGQSGVRAEFESNAVGGANVKSRTIRMGGSSGGRNTSGVFRRDINNLSQSGKRNITFEITDTRNRKTTATRSIDVLPYSPPRLAEFEVDRKEDDNSIVNVYARTDSSFLGGKNELRVSLAYKRSTEDNWTTNPTTTTLDDYDKVTQFSGISISNSYDFRVEVEDDLGQTASSVISVGTAKVLMSYNKDEGVGIGKIHERGDLDVSGNMYLDGFFSIGNAETPTSEIRMVSSTPGYGNAGVELTSNKDDGVTYIDFNTTRNSSDSGIGDARIRASGGDPNEDSQGNLSLWSGSLNLVTDVLEWNGDHIMNYGTNSNGYWVRYHDGTMIQRSNMMSFDSSTLPRGVKNGAGFFQSDRIVFRFPTDFFRNPTITFAHSLNGSPIWHAVSHNYTGNASMYLYSTKERAGSGNFWFTAIGRWKD